MRFSIFGLKIEKNEKNEKKNQNCRRKLKFDSYDAEYQADSENILYVNINFINRRARASADEQKRISRREACVHADARWIERTC